MTMAESCSRTPHARDGGLAIDLARGWASCRCSRSDRSEGHELHCEKGGVVRDGGVRFHSETVETSIVQGSRGASPLAAFRVLV